MSEGGLTERDVLAGDVSLHVREARPTGGVGKDTPLVVLLHGFPESSATWNGQLASLARAGFWAVAPDMPGYGTSARLGDVNGYRVEALAAVVADLVKALGRTRAHVVGHDWGAIVAWHLAMEAPDVVERLVIVNVPHPVVMGRALRTAAQLRRSWYVFLFQVPGLAEATLAAAGHRALRRSLAKEGLPQDHVDAYVAALAAPGAIPAALAYYRASFRRLVAGDPPRVRPIPHEVLVVWGDRDRYLGPTLAEPPRGLVPSARVVHVPDAGHWVHVEARAEVDAHLLAHLRGAGAGPSA